MLGAVAKCDAGAQICGLKRRRLASKREVVFVFNAARRPPWAIPKMEKTWIVFPLKSAMYRYWSVAERLRGFHRDRDMRPGDLECSRCEFRARSPSCCTLCGAGGAEGWWVSRQHCSAMGAGASSRRETDDAARTSPAALQWQDATKLFAEIDADGDGKIRKAEFEGLPEKDEDLGGEREKLTAFWSAKLEKAKAHYDAQLRARWQLRRAPCRLHRVRYLDRCAHRELYDPLESGRLGLVIAALAVDDIICTVIKYDVTVVGEIAIFYVCLRLDINLSNIEYVGITRDVVRIGIRKG